MARREWAEREVMKRLSGGWSGDAFAMGKNEAMDMLTNEHARAVRIVSQYMKRYGTEGSPCELKIGRAHV